MPTDIDIDLADLMERIKTSLPENIEVEMYREDPIAFGLKALVVNFLLEDKEGGTTPLEEAVLALEGVENAEVIGVTKI
jgi:elongation factor 1-beta